MRCVVAMPSPEPIEYLRPFLRRRASLVGAMSQSLRRSPIFAFCHAMRRSARHVRLSPKRRDARPRVTDNATALRR